MGVHHGNQIPHLIPAVSNGRQNIHPPLLNVSCLGCHGSHLDSSNGHSGFGDLKYTSHKESYNIPLDKLK